MNKVTIHAEAFAKAALADLIKRADPQKFGRAIPQNQIKRALRDAVLYGYTFRQIGGKR